MGRCNDLDTNMLFLLRNIVSQCKLIADFFLYKKDFGPHLFIYPTYTTCIHLNFMYTRVRLWAQSI